MRVLWWIITRGKKLSPETKSRVIIFLSRVITTITPSSKGSMFFIILNALCFEPVHACFPLYFVVTCMLYVFSSKEKWSTSGIFNKNNHRKINKCKKTGSIIKEIKQLTMLYNCSSCPWLNRETSVGAGVIFFPLGNVRSQRVIIFKYYHPLSRIGKK